LNYKKLSEEIALSAYSGMTNAQIANEINIKNKTSLRETYATSLTILAVLGAANGAAFLDVLESIAATNSSVKWSMKNIASTGIDVANTEVRNMLDQLMAAGALVQSDVNTIKALAERTVSRGEELGISEVSEQMVETAVGGIW